VLTALLIGSVTLIINLAIQVTALVLVIRALIRRLDRGGVEPSFGTDIIMMGYVLAMLFAGHLLQFAIWAALFQAMGEFSDFETALYHSVVNFTSLGYGDIVMSERWRLLGALEAANGVLMFGLTTGGMMPIMTSLFGRHRKSQQAPHKARAPHRKD
jgi:hypothetical protein